MRIYAEVLWRVIGTVGNWDQVGSVQERSLYCGKSPEEIFGSIHRGHVETTQLKILPIGRQTRQNIYPPAPVSNWLRAMRASVPRHWELSRHTGEMVSCSLREVLTKNEDSRSCVCGRRYFPEMTQYAPIPPAVLIVWVWYSSLWEMGPQLFLSNPYKFLWLPPWVGCSRSNAGEARWKGKTMYILPCSFVRLAFGALNCHVKPLRPAMKKPVCPIKRPVWTGTGSPYPKPECEWDGLEVDLSAQPCFNIWCHSSWSRSMLFHWSLLTLKMHDQNDICFKLVSLHVCVCVFTYSRYVTFYNLALEVT